MITNLKIYIPRLEDYWYEQKLQSDPNTMSYNAGWDVSYDGYHYDTGCIDFPKNKWEDTFNKRKNENKFFAYLKDTNINEYVGYINYHYNKNENKKDTIEYLISAKSLKYYIVNLDKAYNLSSVAETSNFKGSITEIKFKGTTLIHVKDAKIEKAYEGYEEIEKYLKSIKT